MAPKNFNDTYIYDILHMVMDKPRLPQQLTEQQSILKINICSRTAYTF